MHWKLAAGATLATNAQQGDATVAIAAHATVVSSNTTTTTTTTTNSTTMPSSTTY